LTSQTAHDDLSWIRLLSTSSMHHQRHRRHPIFSIQPSKCPDSRFRTRKNGPRTRSSRTSPDTYYNAQCCSTRRQVTHRSSATVITPHHLGLLAGILQRNASKIIRQVHERQDEAIETSRLLVRHPETPAGMSQRCSFDKSRVPLFNRSNSTVVLYQVPAEQQANSRLQLRVSRLSKAPI
jgi:hypothetical protein